jgi:hypothetical protein
MLVDHATAFDGQGNGDMCSQTLLFVHVFLRFCGEKRGTDEMARRCEKGSFPGTGRITLWRGLHLYIPTHFCQKRLL